MIFYWSGVRKMLFIKGNNSLKLLIPLYLISPIGYNFIWKNHVDNNTLPMPELLDIRLIPWYKYLSTDNLSGRSGNLLIDDEFRASR